jgi:hypothetical protein
MFTVVIRTYAGKLGASDAHKQKPLLWRLAWAGGGGNIVASYWPADAFLAGCWQRRLTTGFLLRAELWLPSVMLAVPSGAACRLSIYSLQA